MPVSRSFEAEDSDSSNEDNLSDLSSFNEWLLLAASELNKLLEIFVKYVNLPWIAGVGNIGAVLSYVAGGGRDLDCIEEC